MSHEIQDELQEQCRAPQPEGLVSRDIAIEEVDTTQDSTAARIFAGARHLLDLATEGVAQGIKNRTIDL